MLRPAEVTVAHANVDVGVAFSFKPLHCRLRELLDDCDAVPPPSEFGEHRRLIAEPVPTSRTTSSGLSSSKSVITATMSGCEIVLSKPSGSGRLDLNRHE